jgi:cytochrome c oxidase subunit IV
METAHKNSSLASYFVVYFCILAISALQIVIAYGHIDGAQMFIRMLLLAIVQTALAVGFFMHMRAEKRNLVLFLVPATIFVLTMMNMFWADSFRLLNLRPLFAH